MTGAIHGFSLICVLSTHIFVSLLQLEGRTGPHQSRFDLVCFRSWETEKCSNKCPLFLPFCGKHPLKSLQPIKSKMKCQSFGCNAVSKTRHGMVFVPNGRHRMVVDGFPRTWFKLGWSCWRLYKPVTTWISLFIWSPCRKRRHRARFCVHTLVTNLFLVKWTQPAKQLTPQRDHAC